MSAHSRLPPPSPLCVCAPQGVQKLTDFAKGRSVHNTRGEADLLLWQLLLAMVHDRGAQRGSKGALFHQKCTTKTRDKIGENPPCLSHQYVKPRRPLFSHSPSPPLTLTLPPFILGDLLKSPKSLETEFLKHLDNTRGDTSGYGGAHAGPTTSSASATAPPTQPRVLSQEEYTKVRRRFMKGNKTTSQNRRK